MSTLGKAKAKYIAEISEGELAIRMAEAAIGMKRPPGKSVLRMPGFIPGGLGRGVPASL